MKINPTALLLPAAFATLAVLTYQPADAQNSGGISLPRERVGKIVFVSGRNDIIDLRKKKSKKAELEDTIYKTDEIRTGPDGRVDIVSRSGTNLSVYPRSVLNIYKEVVGNKTKWLIRLLTGQIRITFNSEMPDNHVFLLKTSVALAQAMGTDFGVISSLEETRIVVFSGSVRVANRSPLFRQSYMLNERNEIKVLKNREPLPPRLLPDDTVREWFERYYINAYSKIDRKIRERNTWLDQFIRKKAIH